MFFTLGMLSVFLLLSLYLFCFENVFSKNTYFNTSLINKYIDRTFISFLYSSVKNQRVKIYIFKIGNLDNFC